MPPVHSVATFQVMEFTFLNKDEGDTQTLSMMNLFFLNVARRNKETGEVNTFLDIVTVWSLLVQACRMSSE